MSKEYNCEICSKKDEMSLRALSVCPSCKRKYHELRKENEELANDVAKEEEKNIKFLNQIAQLESLVDERAWETFCNLNEELAEFKANGIFPKYKIGQEVWFIFEDGCMQPLKIEAIIVADEILYDTEIGCIPEEKFFGTLQSALNQMREETKC